MKKVLVISLFILSFSSCKHETNKTIISEPKYKIDTLINNFKVTVNLENKYLIKDQQNKIIIEVENISNEKLIVYSSKSEATIKTGDCEGSFLITPTLEANQVKLFINQLYLGEIQKIGDLSLKTRK